MTSLNRPLSALLSQALIAYTFDFDAALEEMFRRVGQKAPPSLAMWANVLRFIGEDGVALQALPSLSGIAKPAIKSTVDYLQRHGWIEIAAGEVVHFTERGAAAQRAYSEAHVIVQRRWKTLLGDETLAMFEASLQNVTARLGSGFPEYPMPFPHRGAHPTGQ